VDLVVDSVGGKVLMGSMQSLRYRGRAITVGSAGRDPQPFDVGLLGAGNHSLTGVFLGAEMINERTREMIQRHVDDVAAGRLRVVIDRTYPLADAAAAHAYLESRQAVGRVVLIP
jgi:NADPH2:quinone reductase